jgi:hypothetical protein
MLTPTELCLQTGGPAAVVSSQQHAYEDHVGRAEQNGINVTLTIPSHLHPLH